MQNFRVTNKKSIMVCYGIFCSGQYLKFKARVKQTRSKENKSLLDKLFQKRNKSFLCQLWISELLLQFF